MSVGLSTKPEAHCNSEEFPEKRRKPYSNRPPKKGTKEAKDHEFRARETTKNLGPSAKLRTKTNRKKRLYNK